MSILLSAKKDVSTI